MDYRKVKNLLNKETSSERAQARIAGMSPTGFKSMMERKTMTVETLERIAKYFNKPLNYFSDSNDDKDSANEPGVNFYSCPDCIEKQKMIDELKDKYETLQGKYTSCLEELLGKKGNAAANSA